MGATARKDEVIEESARDVVREAVEQAVEQAKGVLLDAIPFLRERAKRDVDLYNVLLGDYLHTACWEALRKYAHDERRIIWTAPNSDTQQKGGRVAYLAQANLNNLFTFRLPIRGLPMLGMCTYEQIKEAVDFYFGQAKDMQQKGQFLSFILDVLKSKKKTVQQQLKIEDLQGAYNRAHQE